MSSYHDQQVVEMVFDNKKFEANAAKSIKTIDRLKSKLHFKKEASDGFQSITDAANKVDMGHITDSLHQVTKAFGLFDAMHLEMVTRWSKRIVDYGEKQLKAFTLEPVSQGWNKYADKAGYVQTIINATGMSIEKTNSYLDKLMWYSDETSYSFSDMTNALGTMLAAGGDINKLIPMIEGMANATSFAGKGAAEFNRVLFNLNQSYSQGFLNLMDWKSVQLAGVNTKQLIETLIQTGEELGKIRKGEVTTANFTTTLAKRWADTEVMEKGFAKFAEATEEAYAMVERGEVSNATEAYALLSKRMQGVGITAAKAAQEAKTFNEAMGATKDAVATKYMTIFEYVFGNYQQSKVTWTNLANDLWEIFAGPFDDIQEMSGFDALTAGAKAAGLDIGMLKQTLIDLAVQDGILSKSEAQLGNLFSENADKAWISSELYQAAVNKMIASNDRNIESLKRTWTKQQLANFDNWVTKTGKSIDELSTWQLQSLGLTKETAKEFATTTKVLENYQATLKGTDSDLDELISKINDPSQYEMGFTEMFKRAFNDYAWNDITAGLNESGLAFDDFSETLKQVGVETGKVTKQMIDESGGLVESFESGWLDQDTYIAALDKYASQQNEAAQKIRDGMTSDQKYYYDKYIVEQGKSLDQLAKWQLNAIGAKGQELAAYKERQNLIQEYIDKVREGKTATREMFDGLVERAGRRSVEASIGNLTASLMSLKNLFSGVLSVIFPASDEQKVAFIKSIAQSVESFTEKLIISDETIDTITGRLAEIRSFAKFIWANIKPLFETLKSSGVDAFKYIRNKLPDIGQLLSNAFVNARAWLEENDRLANGVRYLQDLYKGLIKLGKKLFSRFVNGEITFDTVRESAQSLYDLVRTKLANLISIIDPNGRLQEALNWITEKLKSAKKTLDDIKNEKFDNIEEFMSRVFKGAGDVKTTFFDTISKWATTAYNTVIEGYQAIRGVVGATMTWIVTAARYIGKTIGAFIGEVTLSDILSFVKVITVVAVLNKIISPFTDTIKGLVNAFNIAAKGIKAIGQGIKFAGLAFLVMSIGNTVGILAKYSWTDSLKAIAIMTLVVAELIAAIAIIDKLNSASKKKTGKKDSTGNINDAVLSVVGISAAVLAMATALSMIMDALGTDPNRFRIALEIVGAVFAVTAGLMALVGVAYKNVNTKGIALTIMAIPIAMGGILYVAKLIYDYLKKIEAANAAGDYSKLAKVIGSIVAIVVLIGGLIVAMRLLSKAKINTTAVAAALLAIGATVAIMTGSIYVMTKAMSGNTPAAIGSAIIVGALLLEFMWLLKGFEKGAKISLKATAAILAFGTILLEMAVIIGVMTLLPTGKLIGTAAAFALAIGAMALVFAELAKITKNVKSGSLLLMIATLGAIVAGLVILDMQMGSALTALGYGLALAGSLLAVAGVLAIISKVTRKFKYYAIFAPVAAMALIAATMIAVANYIPDATTAMLIGLTLAGTLLAVALSLKIVSMITKGINWMGLLGAIAAIAVVAVAIAAVVLALSKVSRVDMKNVTPVLVALAVGLVALMAVAGLLTAFPVAMAGVIAAIVSIAAIAGTIYLVSSAFNEFADAAIKMGDYLPRLGENLNELSRNLEGTDWDNLKALVDLASSAFLPLLGLGIAAGIVNLSITGLGEKIAALAYGIDLFIRSIGMSSNLGAVFLENIAGSYDYMEAGTEALIDDEKALLTGVDFSDVADDVKAKTRSVGQAAIDGLDFNGLDTSGIPRFKIDFVKALADGFGISEMFESWGAYEPDGLDGDFYIDDLLLEWYGNHSQGFSWTDDEWAELLGLSPEVIKGMKEIAAEKAAESSDIIAEELARVFAGPDEYGFDITDTDRSMYVNSLLGEYRRRQLQLLTEETETVAEEIVSETDKAIADGIEAGIEKDSELPDSPSVYEMAQRNAVSKYVEKLGDSSKLTQEEIDKMVDEAVSGNYNKTEIMAMVSKAYNSMQPEPIDLTGGFSLVLNKAITGGGWDASTVKELATQVTVDNFELLPDGIRDGLASALGTTDPTEIVDKVKTMDAQSLLGIVQDKILSGDTNLDPSKWFTDALSQFFGEGSEIDLGAIFGANMTGTFADNLPEGYFEGTDKIFAGEADACIKAFTDALKSDSNVLLLINAADTIGSTVADPISDKLSEGAMTEQGSNIVTGLSSGMHSKRVVATNEASSIGRSVAGALKAYSEASSAGLNIMLGLEDGMKGRAVITGNVAAQIGRDIVNRIARAAGVASPSKLTREIGGYMMEGLQLGMLDEETNTFYAADVLVSGMIDRMADAVTMINEIVDNAIDDQPVIKPLMDLSEIEYGAKRIGDLTNTNVAARIQNSRAETEAATSSTVQNGNPVVNYTQNNYSPKSLSRIEIYRQTKNQLSMLNV